jgi:hypothetical protein
MYITRGLEASLNIYKRERSSTIDTYKNIKIEYLYSKQKSQKHNREVALKELRMHASCRTVHTVSDHT